MTRAEAEARIYTVGDVLSGVAVGAHSFRRLKDARTEVARFQAGRDLQEDDVRLFESVWDARSDEEQVAEIDVP